MDKLTDDQLDKFATRFAVLFWLGAALIFVLAFLLSLAVYRLING